tara:strand:+ start:926 stop:1654 length:729 start_codon:yes stop_codon:yes gene_type:complete
MKINNIYSPNFDKKARSSNSVKLLVIHYTGMQSQRESLIRLCNSKSKVSSHYLISRNGKIFRLVSEDKIAWHAGKSCWRKFRNLNKNSIGIELVNRGHEFGYTKFTKKQLLSLITICRKLVNKYKIKKQNIIGHSDIAPSRKIDPGEKFPWEKLAKNRIGIWHDCKLNFLKKYRRKKVLKKKDLTKFIRNLGKIGYCFKSHSKRHFLNRVVEAFQRHFRKELIDGIIDKECLLIAQNLSQKL